MDDISNFRRSVERFIEATGVSATRFGLEFAADPRFVFDLRNGREPRGRTRAKVISAMAEYSGTQSEAAE